MAVRKVGAASFEREVLNSDVPVVVGFYAYWSGLCHMPSPALDALSEK